MKTLCMCIAAASILAGCGIGYRHHDVADVKKTETILLAKRPSQGPIASLTVEGSGRIDGAAEIVLILNGGPYKTESLSGPVKFQWGGDWYADDAEIRYSPTSATGGTLRLRYRFN
jgi:hypothetical protein